MLEQSLPMDNHKIALEQQGGKVGIEMYLEPALEATETIFGREDGKFKDKREVVAGHPPHCGTAIRVDLPRPSGEFNQFIDVIPDRVLQQAQADERNPSRC
jgi:hypothetical protein